MTRSLHEPAVHRRKRFWRGESRPAPPSGPAKGDERSAWAGLAAWPRKAAASLARRVNRTLNKWELRHRRTRLTSLPWDIVIDPVNCCNLRCPFCPTGQGVMESPGKISLETFRTIYEQFRRSAYKVRLYNWGESFLHSDLLTMIGHVARDGIRSYVTSNLNVAMSADFAEALVQSGLTKLTVSMDGNTQATYEQYRRRGNLERLRANLRLILEARRKLASALPCIEVQFIVFSHNEHEVQQARQACEQMGVDKFFLAPANLDLTHAAEQPASVGLAHNASWLPANPQYSRYASGMWKFRPQVCKFLWTTAKFRWDGTIYPCCVLYRDADGFGNVLETPFREIWNGPQYRAARALFTGASIPDHDDAPCTRCYRNGGYRATDQ